MFISFILQIYQPRPVLLYRRKMYITLYTKKPALTIYYYSLFHCWLSFFSLLLMQHVCDAISGNFVFSIQDCPTSMLNYTEL